MNACSGRDAKTQSGPSVMPERQHDHGHREVVCKDMASHCAPGVILAAAPRISLDEPITEHVHSEEQGKDVSHRRREGRHAVSRLTVSGFFGAEMSGVCSRADSFLTGSLMWGGTQESTPDGV